MSSPSRAQIAELLLDLPESKLELADDFISFLAGGGAPAQPSELTPVEDAASYFSLAWLTRIVFGSPDFPDDGEPVVRPPYERLEGVPLEGQEQSEWCWAAAAQMIMVYHGASVSQQDLAKDVGNEPDAPPFNSDWGFTAEEKLFETLSPEEVEAEIDARRPFVVSWRYSRTSAHFLVITGYLRIGEELWLVAHDPWQRRQVSHLL